MVQEIRSVQQNLSQVIAKSGTDIYSSLAGHTQKREVPCAILVSTLLGNGGYWVTIIWFERDYLLVSDVCYGCEVTVLFMCMMFSRFLSTCSNTFHCLPTIHSPSVSPDSYDGTQP